MTNINAQGAGHSFFFTICQNTMETPSPDAHLQESTGLVNEQKSSADFISKFGDPLDLVPLSAHALPPRMVALMRTRPRVAIPIDSNVSKKSTKSSSRTPKAESLPNVSTMKIRNQNPSTQRPQIQTNLIQATYSGSRTDLHP